MTAAQREEESMSTGTGTLKGAIKDRGMRRDVLEKRYLWRDSDGRLIEDWAGLCSRVASTLAATEEERAEFFDVMHQALFLPNSPTLMNAGRERFTLSACFVLPVGDSMEEIFESVKHMAIIQKMGGGTGFNFSRLRPNGSIVGSTNGVASGPISFMRCFDTTSDVTKQGGTRRGANMGILRVDHPDIYEFIDCKKEEGAFNNFNLSVGITDAFMDAVRDDTLFDLVWEGACVKRVKARELFNLIVNRAWSNGEPGIVFLDRIDADNPTPHVGRIEGTNPCGEQPLLPYEACVLGSVNLSLMVADGAVDWDLLRRTVHAGVRMLDGIIDIQPYPLAEIERMHKGNRKVGVGVMGWADLLIRLEIDYASPRAIELAGTVMQFITDAAVEASAALAGEKGVFPNWEGSTWQQQGLRVRNATLTTIAPTGSISIIANTSSGIEPLFGLYTEQKRVGDDFGVWHPLFTEWAEQHGAKVEVDKRGDVVVTNAVIPSFFATCRQIPVEWHIRHLAAFQAHTHNAVSKTINLPESATEEDVGAAFRLVYDLGCKGVTVYRDGSRKEQVISTGKKKATAAALQGAVLPDVMDAKRIRIETPEGEVYFHVSLTEAKNPVELFIRAPVKSKFLEVLELFSRFASLALRYGCPSGKVISQLEKVQEMYGSVSSVSGLLLRAFKKIGVNGRKHADVCPECEGVVVVEEGCVKCHSCGYTKC